MGALRIAERAKDVAIVFKTIRPQILQNRPDLAKLREAIEPIWGFEWSRALNEIVGSKPINDIMACIKSTIPPLEEINTLRKMPKETFRNSEIILPESWGIWRTMITKFHLYEILSFSKWIVPISRLGTALISAPVDLAQLKFSEALVCDQNWDLGGNLSILWQSSKC